MEASVVEALWVILESSCLRRKENVLVDGEALVELLLKGRWPKVFVCVSKIGRALRERWRFLFAFKLF